MSAHETRKDYLSKTICAGFLIALVFTALAHGAVEPWSVFIFEAMILLLLLLWCIKVLADKRLKLTVPQTAFPVAALAAVGVVQSVVITDGAGRWLSLSKNVGYTRAAATVLIFLLISFLVASNFFATRERLSTLGHFLVIYGLAMALFGLLQHFAWNGSFYWLRPTEAPSPFGPFVNRNHFAGYMELLIPVPVALIIARAVRTELRIFYGFAAMMMGVAAATSLSRGGMISIAASMVFLVLMSARMLRSRPMSSVKRVWLFATPAAVVIGTVAIIVAGIFWVGADPVINRVTHRTSDGYSRRETFYSGRGWIWRDTVPMIRANPLLGVGLGAYETAFSIYARSDGSVRVGHSHNDYLQVVADCGIVGGLIAVWFIASLFRAVARGIRSPDPLLAGLTLGGGAGLFAMLVHSIFDFNLQVPSNALLFLLLAAVVTHVGTVVRVKEDNAEIARLNIK